MLSEMENFDDVTIAQLYAKLSAGHEPGWNTTTYEVLRRVLAGKSSLNLNRMFKLWSSPIKMCALATVFDLVEESSVESLDLRNNALDPDEMRVAFASSKSGRRRRLTRLKSLDLSQNELGTSKGGISWLAEAITAGSLPSLLKLSLSGNSFAYSDIEVLANALVLLPKLQTLCLKLEYSKIGTPEAPSLALCMGNGWIPNLQELRISSQNRETEGAMGLAQGIEALANAFKTGYVSKLKVLDLGHNDISESAHLSLAEALEAGFLQALKELRLKSSGLNDAGLMAYSRAVESKGLKALQVLDLSWNRVGNEAAKVLAEAIKIGQVKDLREINLARTNIGDEGVFAFATSFELGQFPRFQLLDLYGTQVGDGGISKLAQVLGAGHLNTLESLNVLGTLCTDMTETACVAAGCQNSLLTFRLAVDCNDVSGSWERIRQKNVKAMTLKAATRRSPRVHRRKSDLREQELPACWKFIDRGLHCYGLSRSRLSWKVKRK